MMMMITHQMAWQYSDRNPLECRWGRLKSQFTGFAIDNCCILVCILHLATGFLFTAGIGRPSATRCCTARDRPSAVSRCTYSLSAVNRVYDSKARLYAEDNRTESNCTYWWIWSRSNYTALEVLYYWSSEANYWHIRSIARHLCDSRATCIILSAYSNDMLQLLHTSVKTSASARYKPAIRGCTPLGMQVG